MRAITDLRTAFLQRIDQRGPVPPHCPELGPCWIWTGSTFPSTGYGRLKVRGRTLVAHRLAWELFRGPIPTGLFVCHHCDNRACVNYERHLFVGTQSENLFDQGRKGRNIMQTNPEKRVHLRGEANGRFGKPGLRGEENGRAKLKRTTVADIRWLHESGLTSQAQIAGSYGVTQSMISKIVRRSHWDEED